MKTMTIINKNIPGRIFWGMLLILSCITGKAQNRNNWDRLHLNVDWQMNIPVDCDFADKASGWGMNFEGKYDLLPKWSVGLFLNFHTNHRYVGRQTLHLDRTASLTTDQQQSAFQLPFGASMAYNFSSTGYARPYFGVKAGAMYMRNSSYNDLYRWREEPWGFYASPELGVYIHPVPSCRLGFHVAAYYSYATNQTDMLDCSLAGRSSFGVRVGICF